MQCASLIIWNIRILGTLGHSKSAKAPNNTVTTVYVYVCVVIYVCLCLTLSLWVLEWRRMLFSEILWVLISSLKKHSTLSLHEIGQAWKVAPAIAAFVKIGRTCLFFSTHKIAIFIRQNMNINNLENENSNYQFCDSIKFWCSGGQKSMKKLNFNFKTQTKFAVISKMWRELRPAHAH